ncbi:MAG: hypothetical protein EBR09_06360 [Proteobacteria bacterium]|nr:hypothetical protein [Pseudomonadota bacterium]
MKTNPSAFRLLTSIIFLFSVLQTAAAQGVTDSSNPTKTRGQIGAGGIGSGKEAAAGESPNKEKQKENAKEKPDSDSVDNDGDSKDGNDTSKDSKAAEKSQKKDQDSSDKPTVTKQKICQLLIETNDVELRLLKAGTLLNVTRKNKVLVARINRVTANKIFATLRKKDCTTDALGGVVSRRTESAAESSSESASTAAGRANSPKPDNDSEEAQNQPEQSPKTAPKSDDGSQILLGINYFGSPRTDYTETPSHLRATYEFFFGPPNRGLRRSREGATLGAGIALTGFELFILDSEKKFMPPMGYIFLRGGFRWISSSYSFALMPTLDYMFMAQGTKDGIKYVKYFPDVWNKIGSDLQTDFNISDTLRLVVVLNYTFLYTGDSRRNLNKGMTQFQALTGIKWDN